MKKKKGSDFVAAMEKEVTRNATLPPAPVKADKYVQINLQIDPAVKFQLDTLKLELRAKSTKSLWMEAINDFFEKHGKDRIA